MLVGIFSTRAGDTHYRLKRLEMIERLVARLTEVD